MAIGDLRQLSQGFFGDEQFKGFVGRDFLAFYQCESVAVGGYHPHSFFVDFDLCP